MTLRLTLPLAVLVLLAGAGRTARAQPVKPNILIVFDTSGTMLTNSFGGRTGDGSLLCGGVDTTSRVYNLKRGIVAALEEAGTDEANFGLMRFPQYEQPAISPVVCNGSGSLNFSCGPGGSESCACAGHYCTVFEENYGCKMSTDPSSGTYGSWFDTDFRQSFLVDVTKRPSGSTKPLVSDFDPADGNIRTVVSWMDQTESGVDVAATTVPDPEIHILNNTPAGRTLFYARLYFENYIKPVDSRSCRQDIVIFITDDDIYNNNCDAFGGVITVGAGCTGASQFHPQIAACKLLALGVKTYILTNTGAGATNSPVAVAGGTGAAIEVSLTDPSSIKAKLVEIIANAVPPAERCNGVDDNCNGMTDEGVSNKCAFDPVGLKHCAVEACNCLDDDCDGKTDQGLPLNGCGLPCGCKNPEVCDGLDNDCDGVVDNGFDVGTACDNGLLGACHRTGTKECKADKSGTACTAPPATGTPEICNGLDDDCDGMTDEPDSPGGMLPGEGEACGMDVGACKAGTTYCDMGMLKCKTTMGGTPEICNGLDDDCNGVTDDGTFPEVGMECVCPGLDPAKAGVGECHKGKYVCKGTMGITCEGCGMPMAELCDGKDNDCDGKTDYMAPCPDGFSCKDGQCAIPCVAGEFPCPACYKCNPDRYCIQQKCCGVKCDAGLRCEEATGTCKDPCAGVMCSAPQFCRDGVCIDCFTTGCPKAGEKCIVGLCQPDPCANSNCGIDEYCDNGACVPLCDKVKCEKGQLCVAGVCRSDLCAAVACPQNQYCDSASGECKPDPCATKQCEAGKRCVAATGRCEVDPCTLINCLHPCLQCQTTADGTGQCIPDTRCKSDRTGVFSTGGGGCKCATGPRAPGDGLPWLVALASAVLGFRRRRSAPDMGRAIPRQLQEASMPPPEILR